MHPGRVGLDVVEEVHLHIVHGGPVVLREGGREGEREEGGREGGREGTSDLGGSRIGTLRVKAEENSHRKNKANEQRKRRKDG